MQIINLKRIIISLGIVLLILVGVLFFSLTQTFTGEVVKNSYTYTKAICNKTSYGWFCQDHTIICEENQTKSITPITGAIVKHPRNWTFSEENNFCDD